MILFKDFLVLLTAKLKSEVSPITDLYFADLNDLYEETKGYDLVLEEPNLETFKGLISELFDSRIAVSPEKDVPRYQSLKNSIMANPKMLFPALFQNDVLAGIKKYHPEKDDALKILKLYKEEEASISAEAAIQLLNNYDTSGNEMVNEETDTNAGVTTQSETQVPDYSSLPGITYTNEDDSQLSREGEQIPQNPTNETMFSDEVAVAVEVFGAPPITEETSNEGEQGNNFFSYSEEEGDESSNAMQEDETDLAQSLFTGDSNGNQTNTSETFEEYVPPTSEETFDSEEELGSIFTSSQGPSYENVMEKATGEEIIDTDKNVLEDEQQEEQQPTFEEVPSNQETNEKIVASSDSVEQNEEVRDVEDSSEEASFKVNKPEHGIKASPIHTNMELPEKYNPKELSSNSETLLKELMGFKEMLNTVSVIASGTMNTRYHSILKQDQMEFFVAKLKQDSPDRIKTMLIHLIVSSWRSGDVEFVSKLIHSIFDIDQLSKEVRNG